MADVMRLFDGDRIEIGRVIGDGIDVWLMFVIEADPDPEAPTYAERYPSRETALAAARTWRLPIHVHEKPGTVEATSSSVEIMIAATAENDNDDDDPDGPDDGERVAA